MTTSLKGMLIGVMSTAGIVGFVFGNFFISTVLLASAAITCNVL